MDGFEVGYDPAGQLSDVDIADIASDIDNILSDEDDYSTEHESDYSIAGLNVDVERGDSSQSNSHAGSESVTEIMDVGSQTQIVEELHESAVENDYESSSNNVSIFSKNLTYI